MPPNRTEQPAPGAEEASSAAAAPAAAAPAGGIKAFLPLVVTVAVMPVLAYVMTSFILVPKLQKSLGIVAAAAGESGEGKSHAAPGAKKETTTMNKLLVNVAGTMGSRYLLVSLTLSGTDPDFKSKIQEFDPQLRDMACGALQTKTLVDLEKPTARNLIRSELLTGFNNILGEMMVQDIYFTEFAIQ